MEDLVTPSKEIIRGPITTIKINARKHRLIQMHRIMVSFEAFQI